MRYQTVFSLACLWLLPLAIARAEVDASPLEVQVVPAFPKLQWPDSITGADEGRRRNILPIILTGTGTGKGQLLVATQYGAVYTFANDPQVSEMTPFLDIREKIHYHPVENEEGFLGLALHPKFAENGQFFVYYTPRHDQQDPNNRRSIVARYHVSEEDPTRADPDSEEVIMEISQPFWNHNGGTLVFGPDGYLYIGLGDGGLRDDPQMNAQNLQTLLGSILRIDVDRPGANRPYSIPDDNPFVGQRRYARGEIWAYGLRNVWRMSFDRKTGTCWAGDVGQDTWEEIDIIRSGGNYGWNLREGKHPFGAGGTGPREDFIEPIWEYGREYGKSITGGCVYRGPSVPELEGAYLYADYVSGRVWALWYDMEAEQVTANRTILEQGGPVIHFGEDDNGEVYFTTFEGGIFKFLSPKQTAAR